MRRGAVEGWFILYIERELLGALKSDLSPMVMRDIDSQHRDTHVTQHTHTLRCEVFFCAFEYIDAVTVH